MTVDQVTRERRSPLLRVCLVSLFAILLTACTPLSMGTTTQDLSYQFRTLHNPDGIGKLYMGREIAQIMGHQGAAWLERPSRNWEEQPDEVVEALHLKPTDVVADIGAGTGYFSFRISSLVPQGEVLAVDVQPEMIDILTMFKEESGVENVTPVLSTDTNPHLPDASVDLARMVDA